MTILEKEFTEIKIVFMAENNANSQIIKDTNTGLPKQFSYRIHDKFLSYIIKQDNSKETLIYELIHERYFWEWLEDIGLVEMTRILNVDFTYNGKDYSFAYLSEEDLDQYWIEAQLYGEEFGMHSNFDL